MSVRMVRGFKIELPFVMSYYIASSGGGYVPQQRIAVHAKSKLTCFFLAS